MRYSAIAVLTAVTVVAPMLGTICVDPAHAHSDETPQFTPPTSPDLAGPEELASLIPTQTPDKVVADVPPPARTEEQAARSDERDPVNGETPEAATHGPEVAAEERATAPAEPPPTVVLPLAQSSFRVSSVYGGRADPFTGAPTFHEGVDLAAPMGAPIYAVADGVVDYVGPGRDGRSSMIIVIAHEVEGQRFYSWYNHMYADDLYVQEGQVVSAGEVIAGVGSNGRSSGPHLHFEIHTDDELSTTDPIAWLQGQDAVDISALA
ncbi:M23 family metallopeptidase [Georgenia sp. Z1344]|uniref:M23 family metallopeptidase n=1 Tax=Georgenia sp. Z1344 TaxID=3416706 RepID=UPI003CEDC388